MRLKCSCVEILEMILERTDERSVILIHSVISELDIHGLLLFMYELWSNTESKHQTSTKQGLFRAYHVLRRIADYKEVDVNVLGMISVHI